MVTYPIYSEVIHIEDLDSMMTDMCCVFLKNGRM